MLKKLMRKSEESIRILSEEEYYACYAKMEITGPFLTESGRLAAKMFRETPVPYELYKKICEGKDVYR